MKTLKLTLRSLYAILAFCSIVAYAIIIVNYVNTGDLFGISDEMLIVEAFLACHAAAFVISLPSLITVLVFISKTTGKAMLAVAAFGIGLLIAPITLIITTIVSVIRLIRDLAKPREIGEDALESTSQEILRISTDRAARRLLDDNFDEDIAIDDGTAVRNFRQIALIEYRGENYALLSPLDEAGNVAYAYRVYLEDEDTYALEHVTDRILYTRIYDKYRRLIES